MKATFRVTTPMFSGGADGVMAELRAPSFKGVLRFWWRACAWTQLDGDLCKIRAEEECVFGSPRTGQSRVAIRLYPTGSVSKLACRDVLTTATGDCAAGVRYLGYGVMHTAGSRKKGVREAELIRECLVPPFDVAVELRLRALQEAQAGLLAEALRALGTLGGMGARSRRGYGSLSLLSIDGGGPVETATSIAGLRTRLGNFGRGGPDALPDYTALSSRSRFLVGRPVDTPMDALRQLGKEYMEFRGSDRRDGRRSTLEDDAKIVRNGRPADAYPKRVAFGLPINYGDNKPVVKPAGHDRRASPLFFHIHDCDDQAVAVVSFLPALFLPDARIVIGGAKKPLPEEPDVVYRPVHEFLNYLSRRGGPFEDVGEVDR